MAYYLSVQVLAPNWTGPSDSAFELVDPSDDLLRRFAGERPPVRKQSDSELPSGGVIRDRKTRTEGIGLRVDRIHWVSDSEVTTYADAYTTEARADSHFYKLQKLDQVWQIVRHNRADLIP